MALFNHLFPYSNFHDINLDWIISIIKSIDPAVIQSLQNLTPDIIEQVNQKVSEAQAFAVSAQSSASEANTARETAVTSANEAAADAATAESAKNAVENSINVSFLGAPEMLNGCSLYSSVIQKMGKWLYVQIFCGIAADRPNDNVAKIDLGTLSPMQAVTVLCFAGATKTTATIALDGNITVEKSISAIDCYIYGIVPLA